MLSPVSLDLLCHLVAHPVGDDSLKVEYQTVTLAQYDVERESDRKQVQQVSNSRLVETPFHSPQLTLFDLEPGEWVLHWRVPDYAPRARRRRIEGLIQPMLFDLPPAKVAGGDEASSLPAPRSRLRLISRPAADRKPEE